MPLSRATVATPDAARYLKRLCNHFAHKLPVEQTDSRGVLRFDFGTCRLDATADALLLDAEAADVEGLERLQNVVVSHLDRFAWKEGQLPVNWQAA
ncbi:DUF2218 domain-containing protein [Pseudomonas sp. ZM23]|uniref:DUF2218 domain-containing protein n=1 Tax=Pseudomonas triclosanedens TaxID=2961893 RepID=A0ABY6ZY12_9PSED|nr:DUF2218 domain-containing protein [Pseudomonas triclosanedens]MCP8462555.1 DUF2218 domain-containing protein [Pseudomonas triclosanedens]MCP8468193.1 DUF2218 domain-containing protein [Pseudomonas triclosanedens]MCP8474952.1 DUF2218 domain-containing protein [Pseudomonas triclosanedens]WAI49746.1 DUF2218 domain-containing protein [Pseudomonas triclosanedens]